MLDLLQPLVLNLQLQYHLVMLDLLHPLVLNLQLLHHQD